MDNAWKTLKNIILILIVIYFVSFLIYSDFLFNLAQAKPKFDFSRYLFKILNLE
jgi:hypothetical protein